MELLVQAPSFLILMFLKPLALLGLMIGHATPVDAAFLGAPSFLTVMSFQSLSLIFHTVDEQGLADRISDSHSGVKRGLRVLKYHLRLFSHLLQLSFIPGHDVVSFIENFARCRLLQP